MDSVATGDVGPIGPVAAGAEVPPDGGCVFEAAGDGIVARSLGSGRKRADIEGLRAVAILAVVAFHVGVGWTPGGYVGVDVFFVISGYLITDHLYRELSSAGAIDLKGFYARRARRLLPSALLVVIVTVAVSAVVLPPLEVPGVTRDGAAAALYFANYRFAAEATNYLAGGSASPLLHYWSLGVEEQFYLVWPCLLLACSLPWLWGGRRNKRRRPAERHRDASWSRDANVVAGLSLVGAASLIFSLWSTRVDEPWAFFSLPTRAWELAAGALVAVGAPALRRLPTTAAAVLGWAGLGGVVWAVVAYSASTAFPGAAALVPVAGAAAILASGLVPRRLGPGALLSRRPLPFLGGVSYTWYLWHWPALVLAPFLLGRSLSIDGRLLVAVVSLGLATVTSVLVERPSRRNSWLVDRSRRSLTLGAVLGLGAAAASLAMAYATPALVGTGRAPDVKLVVPTRAAPVPLSSTHQQLTPVVEAARALTAETHNAVLRSLAMRDVPANLSPSISYVASGSGMAAPFWDGCFDGFTDVGVHPCNYGDLESRTTVVLFGDSHAMMWFPAFDTIAGAEHWHLVVQAKATCPPIDIRVFSPDLDEWYVQCSQWRAAVLARIRVLRPEVVVLGFSREYGVGNDHVVVDGPSWMRGLTRMIRTLRSFGSRVVVMGDVPYPPGLVPNCLSAHLSDLAACEIKKAPPAFNSAHVRKEAGVVEAAGGAYIDTEPWFCGPTTCAVVVGEKVVYHDDNHISAPYASWLTPVISADLRAVTPAHLWRTPAR